MQDTFKHKGLRKILINSLREAKSGRDPITNESVLNAMERVPRHLFMAQGFESYAYQDQAFQIGYGQTISQPYTVAFQTQLLEIKPRDKVLEIGTGSGYQACVLLELGAKVFTIERQKQLFDKTSKLFESLDYQPKMFFGDGNKGLLTFAPFHKILVTCGAEKIPEALKEQLKPGGMIVIPIDIAKGLQEMQRFIKKEDGTFFPPEKHGVFSFVPMLNDHERKGKMMIILEKQRRLDEIK